MPAHDVVTVDPMRTALEYFNGQWPASQYSGITFWRWEDDHNVVAWDDGATIAFREELHGVLNRLSPNGLPPLDSILLLVAASRDTWHRQSRVLTAYRHSLEMEKRAGNLSRADIVEALGHLDRIHELDTELRTPVLAKAHLAELIFESCAERTPLEVAERAVRLLETGMYDIRLPTVKPLSDAVYYRCLDLALRRMAVGLKKAGEESLRLRARTSLEVLPQAAEIPEIEQPDSVRMRSFLKMLDVDEDTELAGLSRLAKILMAAISVPRTIADPDILPLGGIEDISNRGPLDRLVSSELAHDGDLLAARIVNGEALYWRRERPPSPRPKYRYILLESGLRSWGLPRLFAVATAMATIANADRNTSIQCYRAAASEVIPIDLFTRQGLIDHLAVLEKEAHPGLALEAFRSELEKSAEEVDATMILHSAILHDFDFLELLGKSQLPPMLVAGVDGAGNLAVTHRSLRGTKPMGRYKIELEKLFDETVARPRTPLNNESLRRDGPAILFMSKMPLRLGHLLRKDRVASIAGLGIVAVTADKRLMLWYQANKGAFQLLQNLPERGLEILWNSHDIFGDGKAHLILGGNGLSQAWIVEIIPATLQCKLTVISLDRRRHADVSAGDGCIYFVWQNLIQTFSLSNGQPHSPLTSVSKIQYVTGRFVRFSDGNWAVLCFDGNSTQLQKVVPTVDTLAIIEKIGGTAPIAITSKGELRSLDSETPQPVKNLKFEKPSELKRCKTTVVGTDCYLDLMWSDRLEQFQINLSTHEAVKTKNADPFLSNAIYPKVCNVSPRTRFQSIGVDERGRLLALRSKGKSHYFKFSAKTDGSSLQMTSCPECRIVSEHEFKKYDSVRSERGFKLFMAQWEDGSRAFLDSRGLLHLQSSDNDLPEISLVLTEGIVSGWCSDGRLFGQKYYTGMGSDREPEDIFDTVIRKFVARLA